MDKTDAITRAVSRQLSKMHLSIGTCDKSRARARARAAHLRQTEMGTLPKGHTEQQWDRVFKWVNENRAILIRVGKLSVVVDGLRKRTRRVTCCDGGDVDLPERPSGCGTIEINSLVQAAAQAGSGLMVVGDTITSEGATNTKH